MNPAGPGRLITVGDRATLWDTLTGQHVATLGDAAIFCGVTATLDGRRAAVGSGDSHQHFVQLLDLPNRH